MEGAPRGYMELISKSLAVDNKLFYFDLKENTRGQYLKISEKSTISRSTIILPTTGIIWFAKIFTYYVNGDGDDGDLQLESKELQLNNKVFYFDVGDNQRGCYLKISESSVNRNRSMIIVPAGNGALGGWAAFRDVLLEIMETLQLLPPLEDSIDLQKSEDRTYELSDSVGGGFLPRVGVQRSSSGSTAANIPAESSDMATTRVIWAGQKKFFFDMGSNARGHYLRISEVTGSERSVIIIPASALEQFYETLGNSVKVIRNQGISEAGLPSIRTIAPLHKQSNTLNTLEGLKKFKFQ